MLDSKEQISNIVNLFNSIFNVQLDTTEENFSKIEKLIEKIFTTIVQKSVHPCYNVINALIIFNTIYAISPNLYKQIKFLEWGERNESFKRQNNPLWSKELRLFELSKANYLQIKYFDETAILDSIL